LSCTVSFSNSFSFTIAGNPCSPFDNDWLNGNSGSGGNSGGSGGSGPHGGGGSTPPPYYNVDGNPNITSILTTTTLSRDQLTQLTNNPTIANEMASFLTSNNNSVEAISAMIITLEAVDKDFVTTPHNQANFDTWVHPNLPPSLQGVVATDFWDEFNNVKPFIVTANPNWEAWKVFMTSVFNSINKNNLYFHSSILSFDAASINNVLASTNFVTTYTQLEAIYKTKTIDKYTTMSRTDFVNLIKLNPNLVFSIDPVTLLVKLGANGAADALMQILINKA
jgi:hypothetical protein